MNQNDWLISDKINYEFCRRGHVAAAGFAFTGSALVLYPLVESPDLVGPFRLVAALATGASLIRYKHAKKIVASPLDDFFESFRWHSFLIVLISFLTGILFAMPLLDPMVNPHTILLTHIFILGLAATTTSSLALCPKLQLTYIASVVLIPCMLMTLLKDYDSIAMRAMPILVVAFVIYIITNSQHVYANMERRFESEEALRIEKINLMKAIEDLQSAQRELWQQKARAEYASKMASLGQMAGGIAHEVNSPLTIILMNSESLMTSLDDPQFSIEKSKEKIHRIQKTTKRIAQIIRGLLLFSRDGSKDPFQLVSLHQIVERTLDLCRERFHISGIRLEVDSFQDIEMEGREVQMSQVLLNLLNNAFDATRGIEGAWVRVQIKDLGNRVEIAVINNGPPIPENIRENLFQPFFTTKPIGKGTGLGLSISQAIVEDHGGFLKLDEQSAETRFFFQLPKKQLETFAILPPMAANL